MSSLRALFEEARRTRDLQPLVDAVPLSRFIGLALELEGGTLRARLDFDPRLVGNALLPALHGGVLGALLESTAIYALLWDAPSDRVPKTISLTVEYLRSAKPTTTWARTDVTRQGRRVATVRGIAWQDDPARPVAAANAHFLMAQPEE